MITGVGAPIDRVDGRLKVTGGAAYAADVRPERLAYAAVVQSTVARGRIISIEITAAGRAPGILAILTHENAPRLQQPQAGSGNPGENRLPLSDAVIYYAGQHVALVVAETLEQARYAASLVRVRYEGQPPLLELGQGESTATYPVASFGREIQHRRGVPAAALRAPGIFKME